MTLKSNTIETSVESVLQGLYNYLDYKSGATLIPVPLSSPPFEFYKKNSGETGTAG